MNCEVYRTMLDRALDRLATEEELESMRLHEQTCPECAELRSRMEALQLDLASLAEDVPPMPEDFHSSWTALVEEEAMEEKKPNHFRRQLTRFLSVAAAAVFVIGGTALTRDDLAPRRQTTYKSAQTEYASFNPVDTSSNDSLSWASGSTRSSSASMNSMAMNSMAMASYDNVVEEMAEMAYDAAEAPAEEAAAPAKIIRTASLTIATRDYETSLNQLKDSCKAMGGWISYASENTSSGLRRASLTLRIPSAKLDEYLSQTGEAGRVTSRNETSNDVTDSYYDTKTRLATQQALLERLQSLITNAASLTEVLELENQIASTQYQIDRLSGSLISTDKKVDYATVDITLREEKAADVVVQTDLSLGQRLMSALETGWTTFASFCEDMVVFVVAALPFIALVVVAIVVIRVLVKRRKKNADK